jgi:hypothetical protein
MPMSDLLPDYTGAASSSDPVADSAATPYEAVPALAGNDAYIDKMDRLRELTRVKHELFNTDERKGPIGEYEVLKRECAAMQLVAGERSVAFGDLRLMSVAGGVTRGIVTGAALIVETGLAQVDNPNAHDWKILYAIALAAKECDVQTLVDGGISPTIVVAARTADKPRAGSIRAEIVRPKAARSGHGSGVPQ